MPRGNCVGRVPAVEHYTDSVGEALSLTKSIAQYDMTLGITNHQHTGTLHLKFTFVSWFWTICARNGRTGYSVSQAGLAAVRLSLTELCVIQTDGRTQRPRTLTSLHVTLYTSFPYILGAATDDTMYPLYRVGKKWFFQTYGKSSQLKENTTHMAP
jgi:hypothetical protein